LSEDEKECWQIYARVPVSELDQWYAKIPHDFNVHHEHSIHAIVLKFGTVKVGPRGMDHNIWANSPQLSWAPHLSEEEKAKLRAAQEPVYRSTWRCISYSTCPVISTVEDEVVTSDPDGNKTIKKQKRLTRHWCGVKLAVEIYSYDLSEVIIWRNKHQHPDPPASERRTYSVKQFRDMKITARIPHITAAGVKMVLSENAPAGPGLKGLPSGKSVQNCLYGVRRSQQQDRNPFNAIDILVQKYADQVFIYKSLDHESEDCKFRIGVATDYSLDWLIAWSTETIVNMDSSWRQFNSNRAPVTFVQTIHPTNHIVPGAMFISDNIRTGTLTDLLRALHDAVYTRSKTICQGPRTNLEENHPSNETRQAIVRNAQAIVAAGRWAPKAFMIDKDLAEKHALNTVFPDTPVYLCWFHIKEAIKRVGTSRAGAENSTLPIEWFKQRGKGREYDNFVDGDAAHKYEEFMANLQKASIEHAVSEVDAHHAVESMRTYFSKYWIDTEWRETFTDCYLPLGATRDSIFSTNNSAESGIGAFVKIFLNNRANKRLDHLVNILCAKYFVYYRDWLLPEYTTSNANVPVHVQHKMVQGFTMWQDGLVRRLGAYPNLFLVRSQTDNKISYRVDHAEMSCECLDFQHSGKICKHWIAADLHVCNDDNEDLGEEHNAPKELNDASAVVEDEESVLEVSSHGVHDDEFNVEGVYYSSAVVVF
ncbi:hypothetical protein HK102_005873, partial [Quaeritorhiza haematococci]